MWSFFYIVDTLSTALKKVQETLENMKKVQAETTRIIANNLIFNSKVSSNSLELLKSS